VSRSIRTFFAIANLSPQRTQRREEGIAGIALRPLCLCGKAAR
jgi:hypothetical protein